MMKIIIVFLCGLLGCNACLANVVLSAKEVPNTVGRIYTARIVQASNYDPTPNPCYSKGKNCKLYMFFIYESTLPFGPENYRTSDTGWASVSQYRTIGDWVKSGAGDLYREGTDWFVRHLDKRACVVVAAGNATGDMLNNTIVSNCAEGIVQAKTCTLNPNDIQVDLGNLTQGANNVEPVAVPGVVLSCTDKASVHIETNTNESIPLNNSSVVTAQLDWGRGFGQRGDFAVKANVPSPVPLRARLRGGEQATPGVWSGSVVVNVYYD